MKKLLVLILLISIAQDSFSQDVDSLKKYSYKCLVYVTKKYEKGTYMATCFMYKSKNKTYAISNYHVWGGEDPQIAQVINYVIDSIQVLTLSTDNQLIKINLPIETTKDEFYFFQKPDLKAIPITEVKGLKFNYINNLIDTSYFKKIPKKLLCYGYPSSNSIFEINKLNESFTSGYIFEKFDTKLFEPNLSFYPDEDKESIFNQIKETTFLTSIQGQHGMSGAPVFGEFIRENKIVYKFIGVFFAHHNTENVSLIVKAKFAYNYLLKNLE